MEKNKCSFWVICKIFLETMTLYMAIVFGVVAVLGFVIWYNLESEISLLGPILYAFFSLFSAILYRWLNIKQRKEDKKNEKNDL